MRLAFYQPDIPQNLGAAIRVAACFSCALDIIEPCGFPLTTKALRRAAMDYGDLVEITRHDSWSVFERALPAGSRLVLFTTRGAAPLTEVSFTGHEVLLFGRESAGVPDEIHDRADARVFIPMAEGARSLNVAMSAGIAAFEARRQLGVGPA